MDETTSTLRNLLDQGHRVDQHSLLFDVERAWAELSVLEGFLVGLISERSFGAFHQGEHRMLMDQMQATENALNAAEATKQTVAMREYYSQLKSILMPSMQRPSETL